MSDEAGAASPRDYKSELIRAKSFSFFVKVRSGRVASGDRAFVGILRGRQSAAVLQTVFTEGNIEAKMYALVGLRELDQSKFLADIAQLRHKQFSIVRIATEDQGVVEREPGGRVIKRIEAGEFQYWVDIARGIRRKHEKLPNA